jgi:hypothetical protein
MPVYNCSSKSDHNIDIITYVTAISMNPKEIHFTEFTIIHKHD